MKEVCCPIRENAIHNPRLAAVVSTERTLSYRVLDCLVSRVVKTIKLSRITANQRVAIWAPNCLETITLIFALLRMRAVVVLINPRVPSSTVKDLLGQITCQTLLSNLEPDREYKRSFTSIEFNQIFDRVNLNFKADSVEESILFDSSQEATILFTSGTTGSAKAVLHTYGNHWFSALGANDNIPVVEGDRWLLSLGLWHIGGLAIVFRCFFAGGTVVLPPDQKLTNRVFEQSSITHVSLVPTQLRRLLHNLANKSKSGLCSCKCILLGGDVLPGSLISKGLSLGLRIHTTYGCTEMASQVTATRCGEDFKNLLTDGRLLKYRELMVSQQGEILVKGKTLFRGYVEAEDIRRPFDVNGWFHTGDLGELRENGDLLVIGRTDNMFISGGENIQPEEIEAALLNLDFVYRTVVSPAPDNEFGFRPIAFVKMTDGHKLDGNTLARELEKRLPRFKIPVAFCPWPKTAAANFPKVKRRYFNDLAQKARNRLPSITQ